MEITVFHKLYNTYGGHRSFSLAGEYFEYGMPDFGDAIEELDITLHFFQDGPARKTLEKSHEQFHKNLEDLPKCTFYRKKRRLALDFEAKFTTGYEIQKHRKPPIEIIPEWVKLTLDEIIKQLFLLKSKIKKNDNFDFNAFEQYASDKLKNIPTDIIEFEEFEKLYDEHKKKELDKLDDWEKLHIDWEDYFPNIRNIIDQPFQWSSVDEFAPNGNDTGADVLGIFRDWNIRNRKTSPITFLKRLLKGWEIDINNPYSSDYASHTYFQGVVGLAFASCKLRGECEEELKNMAIIAIDKYLNDISTEKNWEYLDEDQKKQLQCKQTIIKMPNK